MALSSMPMVREAIGLGNNENTRVFQKSNVTLNPNRYNKLMLISFCSGRWPGWLGFFCFSSFQVNQISFFSKPQWWHSCMPTFVGTATGWEQLAVLDRSSNMTILKVVVRISLLSMQRRRPQTSWIHYPACFIPSPGRTTACSRRAWER